MKWTSDYEAVEIGGTTLSRMICETAARVGDRPALLRGSSGETVTCAALASRLERVAALGERGFGGEDVLALWAPNVPQWPGVALGTLAAGGTVTGIDPGCSRAS